ncbi:hypothetical protein HGK72_26845 [Mycolicibacterium fortuitum]|uniref:hypothetical protein n=1 Tax=Mycolicibacterium fortuitum TaxID=1766 RepID=UPI0014906850|nr:hypothetical protein [Mycolicibacterium fortuitum]
MRDPNDPYADERQAAGPTAHELWEAQQAREARANRAAAIQACTLCDSDGYRGTRVCDHQDHTRAAKRGMDEIRAKMGWPATGTPTHP